MSVRGFAYQLALSAGYWKDSQADGEYALGTGGGKCDAYTAHNLAASLMWFMLYQAFVMRKQCCIMIVPQLHSCYIFTSPFSCALPWLFIPRIVCGCRGYKEYFFIPPGLGGRAPDKLILLLNVDGLWVPPVLSANAMKH